MSEAIRKAIQALNGSRRYGGRKALAALLKRNPCTLSRWLNGQGSPTHTELQKINDIAAHPERYKEE